MSMCIIYIVYIYSILYIYIYIYVENAAYNYMIIMRFARRAIGRVLSHCSIVAVFIRL